MNFTFGQLLILTGLGFLFFGDITKLQKNLTKFYEKFNKKDK
jgi:sulfite exporter TauE/SafE